MVQIHSHIQMNGTKNQSINNFFVWWMDFIVDEFDGNKFNGSYCTPNMTYKSFNIIKERQQMLCLK